LRSSVAEELSVGIEEYATQEAGTGGRIKVIPEDFVVAEVLKWESRGLILPKASRGYPLYVLSKRGSSSLEACSRISDVAKSQVNLMGLKDKRALTFQLLSLRRKLERPPSPILGMAFSARYVADTVRPLKRSDLLGNFFRVKIRDYGGRMEDIKRTGDLLEDGYLPNFFGFQRFGSGVSNHKVGEAIIRRQFGRAVQLLGAEEEPSDPVAQLRKIPIRIRRLLVQSYQSYLFNRTLSKVIREEGGISRRAHVYILKHRSVLFVDETYRMGDLDAPNAYEAMPLAPIAGYATRNWDDPYSRALANIMKEEGLSTHDFYLKDMQELSQEGGFRPACAIGWFRGATDGREPTVTVGLFSGCYATVVLRELIKPKEPKAAGL
jgi:tRNA pseudouridine13 synthase